ncbi:hypothetical protein M3Y99_01084300 [Aphelenchoides fujianensis]|nr:hypothetical protein M3Y99_01084300 [Aphelenchoides fujianensis]
MRPLLFVILLLAVATSLSTAEQLTIGNDDFLNNTVSAEEPQPVQPLPPGVEIWTPYPQTSKTTTRPATSSSTSTTQRVWTLYGQIVKFNGTEEEFERMQQPLNVQVWTTTTDRPTPTTSETVDPLAAGLLRPTAADTRPSTSTGDPIAAGLLRPTAAEPRRPMSTVDPLAAGLLRPTRLPTRSGCWDEPSAAGAVQVDFVFLLVFISALLC